MPITGLPTFADREIPTHTKLNALRTTVQNKFAGGITGADLKYPFLLGGDLDLNTHTIINFGRGFGDIRFADEFNSIQDAIDDLPATGGIVFLSGTTYTLNATLQMAGTDIQQPKSYVMIVGAGASSIIKASSDIPFGSYVIQMAGDNATATYMQVINCTIDLNNLASRHGINCSRASSSQVSQVWFINGASATGKCITLGASARTRVTGCNFNTAAYGVEITGTPSPFGPYFVGDNIFVSCLTAGVYATDYDYLTVKGNLMTTVGYGVDAQQKDTSKSLIITGNDISTVTNDCIRVTSTTPTRGIGISGNMLAAGTRGVNIVLGAGGIGIQTSAIHIDYNSILSNTQEGVLISAGASSGGAITGNTFYNNCTAAASTYYQLKLAGPNASNRVKIYSITGNTFEKGSGNAPIAPIQLAIGLTQFCAVSGNVGDQVWLEQAQGGTGWSQADGHAVGTNYFSG